MTFSAEEYNWLRVEGAGGGRREAGRVLSDRYTASQTEAAYLVPKMDHFTLLYAPRSTIHCRCPSVPGTGLSAVWALLQQADKVPDSLESTAFSCPLSNQ